MRLYLGGMSKLDTYYLSHFLFISLFLRIPFFHEIPALVEIVIMVLGVVVTNVFMLSILRKTRIYKYFM